MEDIHFQGAHLIQQLLHHLHSFEVAGLIQHKGPPSKAGPVFDDHTGYGPYEVRDRFGRRNLNRKQLPKGLHAIKNPSFARSPDQDLRRRNR